MAPGTQRAAFLVVDDDEIFCSVLARALERRGFSVAAACSVPEAQQLIEKEQPEFAVVDLRIGNDSGLSLVRQLANLSPPAKSVVLTGYGSIATAVEAIKLGALHYLTKPVEVDEILAACRAPRRQPAKRRRRSRSRCPCAAPNGSTSSGCSSNHGGNISAAARALGIHRRTLQRKLRKRPVRS